MARLAQRGRCASSHASETQPGSRGRKAPPAVGVLSVVVRPLAALHVCLLVSLMQFQCCKGPRRAFVQCNVCAPTASAVGYHCSFCARPTQCMLM